MLTKLEQLKQAGYSDEEIGEWERTERLRMQDAGYMDSTIDDYIGVVRPPSEIPPAFIERMKQGNTFQRIIGAMGQYGQMYFGDEPLGFSKENEDFLKKPGILDTLSHTPIYGSLLSPEVFIPAVKSIDALLRSVPAGIGAVGAGIGQAAEEALGHGPYAEGKAARDFASLAQIAALLLGMGRTGAGTTRTLAPKAVNPVIALPRAADFRDAAASIDGRPSTFSTQKKLGRIWTDTGVTPLEVAEDSLRDPSIAEAILSDSDKIPGAYIANARPSAATGVPTSQSAQVVESAQREDVHRSMQPADPPLPSMQVPPSRNLDVSTAAPERGVPQTTEADISSATGDHLESPNRPMIASQDKAGEGRTVEYDREAASAPIPGETPPPAGASSGDLGHEPRAASPENRNIIPLDEDDELAQHQGISAVSLARGKKEKLGVFNPPEKPPRPFSADYPGGRAQAYKDILLTDIEGRPLTAEFVAGRRLLRAPDEALTSADLESAMNRLGIIFVRKPRTRFNPGVYGKYWRYTKEGVPQHQIRISQALSIPDQNIAMAHEFSHAIDVFAGDLSKRLTLDEITPLRLIYGTVRSETPGTAFLHQPERYGYPADQVNAELLAEGIRAYMANPNYFKSVAPKTAAKIRAAINESPALKRVIQFNSLLAGGLVGTGSGKKDDDSR
jgi:hypothetical protein